VQVGKRSRMMKYLRKSMIEVAIMLPIGFAIGTLLDVVLHAARMP
jgi:hypothetical protein